MSDARIVCQTINSSVQFFSCTHPFVAADGIESIVWVTRNILICPVVNRCLQSVNVTSSETYGPAIRVELLGQRSTDATIRAANHHYPTCWINHYQPRHLVRSTRSFANKLQRVVVGQAGFEPTTSSSRTKRATNLRHCPLSRSGTSDASAYVT